MPKLLRHRLPKDVNQRELSSAMNTSMLTTAADRVKSDRLKTSDAQTKPIALSNSLPKPASKVGIRASCIAFNEWKNDIMPKLGCHVKTMAHPSIISASLIVIDGARPCRKCNDVYPFEDLTNDTCEECRKAKSTK